MYMTDLECLLEGKKWDLGYLAIYYDSMLGIAIPRNQYLDTIFFKLTFFIHFNRKKIQQKF